MRSLCGIAVGMFLLPSSLDAQSIDFESPLVREGMKSDLSELALKPSNEVKNALTVLKSQVAAASAMSGTTAEENAISEGVIRAAEWSMANSGRSAPIADQIIIRFSSGATQQEISAVIEEYELEVTEVYVGLGAINANADLGAYFADAKTPEQQLQATIDATNAFTQDARILAATPNIAIEANSDSAPNDSPLVPKMLNGIDLSVEELIDWGMDDIGVVDYWNDPALFGPRIGVIDVGFAAHEDLIFDGPFDGPKNDHGNHVAGIICAAHNGKGISGVVPNCQIVAKTGNFLPVTSEADNVQSFMLLFSQILLSMDEFVTDRDEVVAFNASLGYNWESNFGINPSDPGNELIRANIQNQAIFMFPVLEAANERDILIFSAAGNDSGSDDVRDAIFASPFNWAARTACERLGNCSGIIVEAHDNSGARAGFSNVNGDVSCPGVEVLSAISTDYSAYATMSGTSMASPYCTGGYVIFSMLRPGYSSQEAIRCLLDSGEQQIHGTPRMNVRAALNHCEARS